MGDLDFLGLDDPPAAVCSRCGRKTWEPMVIGAEDRMTQPDGNPCGGRFEEQANQTRATTRAAVAEEIAQAFLDECRCDPGPHDNPAAPCEHWDAAMVARQHATTPEADHG